MRPASFLLALAVVVSAAACGRGGESTGEPHIEEDERRIGAEQHPQLLAEFGGAYRGEESGYTERLGAKVAAVAGLKGECTFTLVNSDIVNAFAVPGCYIYVTRGMLGIVNSEAELAAVLAHELGHIVGDHSERQQRRSLWRGLGVLAVQLVTGSERLTHIAGRAAEFFTLRYSRAQEFESDDLSIRYLRAAGYDPFAASEMLAALARQEGFLNRTRGHDEASAIPQWARTHPLTSDRISRARQAAAGTGLAADALPDNAGSYLREVDGLLYGDDPEQGFVIGRRFAHPVMRIAFEAPEGFTLTNSPQAILIEGPDGLRGEFGGGRMPPGGLAAHVDAMLATLVGDAPVAAGPPQRSVVNGLATMFVSVRAESEAGYVTLTLAAYDAGGGEAYHFILVAPPRRDMPPTVGSLLRSLRRLTPQEAAQLKPRMMAVREVRTGEGVGNFARMMVASHPRELFLMLNGLDDSQPLRSGRLVKIVVQAESANGHNR